MACHILCFKPTNFTKIKEIINNIATINNCAISIPRLNANNGRTIDSVLPNIAFNKYENPIPWIKPKNAAK